jgi:hypothetical protein
VQVSINQLAMLLTHAWWRHHCKEFADVVAVVPLPPRRLLPLHHHLLHGGAPARLLEFCSWYCQHSEIKIDVKKNQCDGAEPRAESFIFPEQEPHQNK